MNLTWEIAGSMTAIVVVVCSALGAYIRGAINATEGRRDEAAKRIECNQQDIKDDLHGMKADFEKRVDRLEQRSADFRAGSAIDASIDHSKRNVMQVVDNLKLSHDRTALAADLLRDRVTRLETQHEQTTKIVGELRTELKDTRTEIMHRFDIMGDLQKQQFDQLCASIREVREIKPR